MVAAYGGVGFQIWLGPLPLTFEKGDGWQQYPGILRIRARPFAFWNWVLAWVQGETICWPELRLGRIT